MEEILGRFLIQKDYRNPLNGEPLSIRKRLETMFSVVTDSHSNHKFTKGERLVAAKLIYQIINELD